MSVTTEAKVGAFVLGCFAILAFTVIYLLNAQMSGGTVPYKTYLRYAGGLEPGASVLFGGIDVGKIKAVRPATTDPTKIEILLDVKEGTPVNEKSVAKIGLVSVMSEAALSITTGSNDAKRLPPGSSIPSQEAASLDEIAGKMATVADNADGLITQARGELEGITGDARRLLANLNTVTGKPNQQKIQAVLDNVNGMLATERPKIDRLTDQLNTLAEHTDATIQNVNGTVTDAREPLHKDLIELQATLQQAKALLSDMQVVVRANDYKIDDTVENLRVATDNLDQLTDSLKQRPWSLVRIRQPKEREVPQQK
jgi:phospholipid/cholesterol/gamma-HCH transport system substrate-binding protein